MKRTICLFLALLMIPITLFSCDKTETSDTVMTLGEYKITSDMYKFWASSYKGYYLYYKDVTDTDEFWDSTFADGMTGEETLNKIVLGNVRQYLICMKLFDEYGLKLSESDKKAVDDYVKDVLKEYAQGNRSMLNLALSEFGVNIKTWKKLQLDELKYTAVYNYLYGKNGINTITDEDRDTYYRENYVRVYQIYINNAYKYTLDKDSDYVYDSDGNIVTEKLDSETKKAKNEKIEAVSKGLQNGEDFFDLYDQYSEFKEYENGFYLSAGSDFTVTEVISAAQKLKPGETTKVESSYGTHFLLCVELDDKAYAEAKNADFFEDFDRNVADDLFYKLLNSYADDVTVNDELLKDLSIRNVTPNYTFN